MKNEQGRTTGTAVHFAFFIFRCSFFIPLWLRPQAALGENVT
jgi:hypothetical protein